MKFPLSVRDKEFKLFASFYQHLQVTGGKFIYVSLTKQTLPFGNFTLLRNLEFV